MKNTTKHIIGYTTIVVNVLNILEKLVSKVYFVNDVKTANKLFEKQIAV